MSPRPSSDTTLQRPEDKGLQSTSEITASNINPLVTRRAGSTSFDEQRLHVTSGSSPRHRRSSTGNVEVNHAWHRTPPFVLDSSPLHRAGLLQARSYNPTNGFGSFQDPTIPSQPRIHPVPHSQDTIRLNTMQLSDMSFSSSSSMSLTNTTSKETGNTGFIFPDAVGSSSSSSSSSEAGEDLSLSQSTFASAEYPASVPSYISSSATSSPRFPQTPTRTPPRSGTSTPRTFQPSGLTLLRQEYESSDGSRTPTAAHHSVCGTNVTITPSTPTSPRPSNPPRVHWRDRPHPNELSLPRIRPAGTSASPTSALTATNTHSPLSPSIYVSSPTENTPLLHDLASSISPSPPSVPPLPPWYTSLPSSSPSKPQPRALPLDLMSRVTQTIKTVSGDAANFLGKITVQDTLNQIPLMVDAVPYILDTVVKSVPAVLLGCLLNILDGVSYGMIIFPGTGVFTGLGPLGVSMFFLSTVIAQLTYTLGGSGFVGANGSMMIEIVPFFHILATTISAYIGEDKPKEVIATTLVAFALSAVLTGLSFLMLGLLKMGVIVGFFPRHILVGCIGGVGVFLIQTGLTVSMRVGENSLGANWETIEMMFLDPHKLILWSLPMGLAVLLRLITHKWHHQLIFPLYFIVISLIFYIIVAAAQVDLWDLRHAGWIFDMGVKKQKAWYELYSYYDFGVVSYGALWTTLPTQFALLFFNILHPPLNVPALSVSLNTDVDTNKELVAHGYSNLLSGFLGSVPNYLVYVNTLLFYRVGGASRIAGFLLAIVNIFLLWVGTAPIAYIPVMVVGALIFVLGIDLVKEALWDTRNRTNRMEYVTIASIMVCMIVWDFVSGVLFGIVISCFFFVVQNSQRTSIRALHSGETAMSTVRRPSSQRAYLREVSKQTTIIRLQGFLFFGTISDVEDTIRGIVQGPSWQISPLQFLVLDLSFVAGVDMSAAEAFVRIHRLLSAKLVTLVFCGLEVESLVGQALESVHVLGSDRVELFATFNDAMEWTENAYLRAWFTSQKYEATSTALELPGRQDGNDAIGSFMSSPRRSYMHDVGNRTIANDIQRQPDPDPAYPFEPYNTLVKTFSSYGELDPDLFRPIGMYLEQMVILEGYVLWEQGEPPDGVYIVQSGVLRASYQFADRTQPVEESMVPGTVAGELSALSGLPRNATVMAERDATVWRLSMDDLERLNMEQPKLAKSFLQLLLKAAKTDHDILLSALTCRQ